MRFQRISVEGSGWFPIQLLSAECAYPATSADAEAIQNPPAGTYRLELRRWVRGSRDRHFLSRRWELAGWTILDSQLT